MTLCFVGCEAEIDLGLRDARPSFWDHNDMESLQQHLKKWTGIQPLDTLGHDIASSISDEEPCKPMPCQRILFDDLTAGTAKPRTKANLQPLHMQEP